MVSKSRNFTCKNTHEIYCCVIVYSVDISFMNLNDYTSYLNIEAIIARLQGRGFYVTNSLVDDLFIYWRVVIAYVVLVMILALIAYKIYHNYFRVLRKYVYKVDEVLYRFVDTVHQKKDTIYQYEETIAVLFAAKKELLHSKNPNYIDGFDVIKKEVEYMEKVVDVTILTKEELAKLDTMRQFVIHTRYNYQRLCILLAFMTGGIYRLAHKKLFY